MRLLPAARAAGVRVVHCLVQRRPDGLGSNHNAKIFAIGRGQVDIAPGTPGAALLPELGPEPSDLVLSRWHGVGPMGGTDLDAILRNLGVSTIVVVGVSLNIAIPNVVMDAVNAAYRVIVPRDAVAGIPTEYGEAIIANTLSLLATITTTDELLRGGDRQAMTDTAPGVRGGFPEDQAGRPRAARAGPVRRRDAPPAGPDRRPAIRTARRGPTAAQHVENACALLDGHQVPEGMAPAGRVIELPGLGHPLLPPWTVTESGPDGVTMRRPLHPIPRGRKQRRARRHDPPVLRLAVRDGGLHSWHPPTRTAYLHVDYRNITPIDEPLTARGRITDIDGRKVFISATMTAADGTLLTEANGLMVRLLPHQP